MNVTIDLIVTRHPTLVELLIERGIATAETPVLEHATPDDVRDKHVLGVLPHHLAAQAASITEIPIRSTVETREAMQRGDLTLEQLRAIAGEPCSYRVRKAEHSGTARKAAALEEALRWANFCGETTLIKFLTNDHAALILVEDAQGYGGAQVDLYRGAFRRISADGTISEWIDPLTGGPWRALVRGEDGVLRRGCGYPIEETEARLRTAAGAVDGLPASHRGVGITYRVNVADGRTLEAWMGIRGDLLTVTERIIRVVSDDPDDVRRSFAAAVVAKIDATLDGESSWACTGV
jgi:hypothetical protein